MSLFGAVTEFAKAPTPPVPPGRLTPRPPDPPPFPPPAFPQGPFPQALPSAAARPALRPLTLRTFVRVGAEYNDNFFRTQQHRKADYREMLTPGAALRLLSGRDEATLAYSPTVIHSSLADEDIRVSHLLDGSGTLGLTERLTLKATERFQQTDEPMFRHPLSLRHDRQIVTTESLAGSLAYVRDTWSLTPRYGLSITAFDTLGTGAAAPTTSPV